MADLATQALAVLLLSLRIAPVLAFAAPFTLLRVPASIRLLLAVSLAAWLAAGNPSTTWRGPFLAAGLVATAVGELALGVTLALALQLAFAALLTAGRAVDIQAGFGLAALVDPATRAQLPLVGTVFAYAAAAIFFGLGGPTDLLAIWQSSIERVPLGAAAIGRDPASMIGFCGAVFVLALGIAGLLLLILLLLDLAIAWLSRTLPQMNVLVLGFQVKAVATLAALPLSISLASALLARLMRRALDTMPLLM
ncbi:MAG: flagellar biosynthetic protein FliR [Sphingomonas sp.]|nr:flagellar biosynthetic protein FliR [Sphingomonas sp.]